MKIGWVGVFGENDSFPFQSWILEIDDESQWEFCDAQVVENLATLDISNAIDGFSFDDDFFVGDEVGNKFADFHLFPTDWISRLLEKWNSSKTEFYNKGVFINFFV